VVAEVAEVGQARRVESSDWSVEELVQDEAVAEVERHSHHCCSLNDAKAEHCLWGRLVNNPKLKVLAVSEEQEEGEAEQHIHCCCLAHPSLEVVYISVPPSGSATQRLR
jgi:hypothetical protein